MQLFSAIWLTSVLSLLATNPVYATPVPPAGGQTAVQDPYPDQATIAAHFVPDPKSRPHIFFANTGRQAKNDNIKLLNDFKATVDGRLFSDAFGTQPEDPRKLFTDARASASRKAIGANRSRNLYLSFAARYSTVFAQKAPGPEAFVLLRALDGPTGPSPTSIWIKDEFPALKLNPNIQRVIMVDPDDFTKQQQIHPPVVAPVAAPVAAPAVEPATNKLKAREPLGLLKSNPKKVSTAPSKPKPTLQISTAPPVKPTVARTSPNAPVPTPIKSTGLALPTRVTTTAPIGKPTSSGPAPSTFTTTKSAVPTTSAVPPTSAVPSTSAVPTTSALPSTSALPLTSALPGDIPVNLVLDWSLPDDDSLFAK